MSAVTAAPVLELDGIDKRFRKRNVLCGLDLSVARGEIVGLLGPNGSGKTTALRIAAGYLWPDRGAVTINGRPMRPDLPLTRASIGYLPERVPLYDPFSVERYLAFVAAARGLDRRRRGAAVERVLNAFLLVDVRRRMIGQLSKGYRQRIGLAQALIAEPDLLLLDEPTNGLDPFQLIEARKLIRAAAADRAVVFSTHIMQEVEALCTRVVYLADGALVNVPTRQEAADSTLELSFSCADVTALMAALGALDSNISCAPPRALDGDRHCVRVCAPRACHAAVLHLVATRAALHSAVPLDDTLEQRLAAVIDPSRNAAGA